MAAKSAFSVLSSGKTAPTWVANIMLNLRIGPQFSLPQTGHLVWAAKNSSVVTDSLMPSAILSARKRDLHSLHSTRGSAKVAVWPEATHVLGFIKIAASMPYISSRLSTKYFHHSFIMFLLSMTPSGPKSQVPAIPPYTSEPGKINPRRLHKLTISSNFVIR